ncbi:MAG: hypothetical protein ISS88_03250 [Candidatus Portnoybacteria bacterium]|nr:hypothetical protein [Candidatus Portnoybacteria bacterium]
MRMEIHSSETLKGMLKSCIKGGNSEMEQEIKSVLDSKGVPYEEPDLEFGWPSSSG